MSDYPPDLSPPLHSNCHIHMLPLIFSICGKPKGWKCHPEKQNESHNRGTRYLRAATHEGKCWKCCCTLQLLLCYCSLCSFANSPFCCGKYFTEILILVGCSSINSICRQEKAQNLPTELNEFRTHSSTQQRATHTRHRVNPSLSQLPPQL